jgi:hypothetical protein
MGLATRDGLERATGWVDALRRMRRAIALGVRGHGAELRRATYTRSRARRSSGRRAIRSSSRALS